jgi:hypothetical protein
LGPRKKNSNPPGKPDTGFSSSCLLSITTTEGAAFSNTAAKELLNWRRADGGTAGCGTTGSEAGALTAVRQSSGISNVFFMQAENTSAWIDFKWGTAIF